ncbi:MAG: hypothetical protein IJK58_03895 [Clostridia bacterium]|nr:hypothetical protein [Clostridia bacterium]
MAKKKNANRGQNVTKKRATPAQKAIRLMCIILAVLMAGGGIVYLVQYILGNIGG